MTIAKIRRLSSTGPVARLVWIAAYLSVTLAALMSTYFFPALHSLLLASKEQRFPAAIGDLGGAQQQQIHGRDPMKWTWEEAPLHFFRGTKQDSSSSLDKKLWKHPPNRGFVPCVLPSRKYKASKGPSRGFLVVQSNGGLNQMRAGVMSYCWELVTCFDSFVFSCQICDMVAVARILNATLVIPELDKRSFWQDSSKFSDIFNEDYFIEALEQDVDIVRKLPKEVADLPKSRKQFRSWSNVKYYEEEIAPLFDEYQVIRAVKSDSRLANNGLPADIQKLRCRVHYDALRFSSRIEEFGKMLVDRMRMHGPYIALHLRYEKDMLAFSGCTHGLTQDESDELADIRESTAHWKVKIINATEQRAKGFCPLTPKEVGIFLQALGYPSATRIYVAAGEIYGGNERMQELQARFPNLMRKETVATPAALAQFSRHASQMAALDYIMSVEADVFVPSYSGNMARAVEGHRRYLGHRKTIIPDRKALVDLIGKTESGVLEDSELSKRIIDIHKRRQGAPRKRKGPVVGSKGKDRFRTEEAFYTNPLPDCLCNKNSDDDNASSQQHTNYTIDALLFGGQG
ncbi:hypothetical protein SELMODRAFT_442298 [Selaginella moellendorffii]|uniref:O-fucosyltransferase family protein n=1 Tax=Selaginella moellendorffii TaxID=88036 RepID=D8RSC2_SELML|nr:hypothetical protein SELMODRAFT_442298 [Selaginella moellendorffii]